MPEEKVQNKKELDFIIEFDTELGTTFEVINVAIGIAHIDIPFPGQNHLLV